ncbi:hypothetical protein AGMMS49587_17580 [Spirochaetia bacterium]|nr:hypothetical protein AGMMS49587_17580 [Spirochaetia bacterium]
MYLKLPLHRTLAVVLLLFASLLPLYGRDISTRKIEDDSALRISLREGWFTGIPSRVLSQRVQMQTLGGGGRVQVRVEAGRDEFAVVLARELIGPAGPTGTYPGWAQGSWILTRRQDTGEASRIRIFPRSDPYTYVQFRPLGDDRCQMDVVLYEAYVVRSQPLPIPFERLLSMPVEEVFSIAGDKFPRRYFDPDADNYRDLRLFMARMRERLGGLEFQDDGAFDENGNYVFIETLETQKDASGLNCSGFAKWVVDGLLRPLTGERLPVTPLKQSFGDRGSSFTKPWEESRDPFFGLDWTRNLASRAMTVLRAPAYAKLEEFEVRHWPFSQIIVRGAAAGSSGLPRTGGFPETPSGASVRAYPGFLENAGFGFEGIHPLLYTLAIDEPGRIYLASINTEMGPPTTEDNPRGRPRMRQHFHIAVLVPYFNEYGNFQVAVFESAEETQFSSFKNRYPGHYVNLVRIPVEGQFDP